MSGRASAFELPRPIRLIERSAFQDGRRSHPPRPTARSAGAPALAVMIVMGLLTAGAIAAVTGATTAPVAGRHTASPYTTPISALLAEARSSAERGHGPGAVSAPSFSSPAAPAPRAGGPNLTFGVSMAYDAYDGYVLAVSLNASGGPFNNTYAPNDLTWKFSAGNWTQLTTTGHVPATLGPGLVYDAKDDYVLLYGGRLMATGAPTAPVTNQTWSYQAGTWSNLSATSTAAPTAVDFPNLVYDGADQYVLLYDELGLSASPNGSLETTWSYAGGVWTNLTGTAGAPPAGWFGSMTYDANDQYVLYFGGFTLANQLTNATYTFHGGVWTNVSGSVVGAPSPRMSFGLAYDSSSQQAVLYGGLVQLNDFNASAYSGETWSYANGTWALIASNGSVYNPQGMVYDVADNETVLLGTNLSALSGANLSVVTWAFSGTTWAVAAPVFGPVPVQMDTGQTVTFRVTESPNDGGLSYNYSGLPPGCLSVDQAQLSCLLGTPGTYHVLVTIHGSAGFAATARTTLDVNAAPAVLQVASTDSVAEVGLAVGIDVTASAGTGTLVYSYSGLPTGCASADTAALTCVPQSAGIFTVGANVTDALGVSDVRHLALTVAPYLSVAALSPNHPAIDAGQLLAVSSTLAGGVGPFVLGYGGLPTGCATTDQTALSCHPAEIGTFAISVAATDQLGATSSATASVTVNALPSVGSFVASNASTPAGGSVQLTALVTGGTGPFLYAYQGLPVGCQAPSGPVVTCSSTPSGQYAVVVTITDGTGATATATAAFTVSPPADHGAPPTAGWFGTIGFDGGLLLGAVAIALAALVGGNRLRLSRQGEQIVRDLQDERSESADPTGPAPSDPEETATAHE